jgi:AcrR family transcriptional regulator
MTRREAILQTATLLFSDKGFKDTSMAEVSKLTGVAGGTIFYHYKNKEELFLSILENVKKSILEEFERYIQEREFDSGLDMVDGAISFYLYLAGVMEEQFLILHRHYPYKLAEVNPVCRSHLEAIYNCFVDIFERALVLGQEDGSVTRELPARKTALILLSMVDGLVRFKAYNLYDTGALINELLAGCRRMLRNKATKK